MVIRTLELASASLNHSRAVPDVCPATEQEMRADSRKLNVSPSSSAGVPFSAILIVRCSDALNPLLVPLTALRVPVPMTVLPSSNSALRSNFVPTSSLLRNPTYTDAGPTAPTAATTVPPVDALASRPEGFTRRIDTVCAALGLLQRQVRVVKLTLTTDPSPQLGWSCAEPSPEEVSSPNSTFVFARTVSGGMTNRTSG